MLTEFFNNYIANPNYLMNITLEITSSCNLKCCHCYVEDRLSKHFGVRQLNVNTIKKIINQAKSLNAVTVTLTGGEPMLHSGFVDIIKLVKKVGFIVFLKTNGTLINSDNIEILKKYVDKVTLSRYGFSRMTYETVTGVNGSYDKYCRAIKLLEQFSVPYEENIILLKENESEIDDFISSGYKIEKYISIHKENPYAAKHRPSDSALYKYYYNLLNHSQMDFPDFFADEGNCNNRAVCNCGTCSLTINANGEINPCTNFDFTFGNVKNTTIKSAWNSPTKKEIMDYCKVSSFCKCLHCEKNRYLLSIAPCNNYSETGNVNDVSSEMCRHCHIVEKVNYDIESRYM
jgi:MoaA/NifB/PqqE/SkfB family radical SAM enzyme